MSPFIFVDDPMSQTTGREVYGWPKVQAWIEPDEPLWATHPRSPTRLFTMKTNVFENVFAGEKDDRRVLVTVDRDMVASWAEFPADLNCPWSPTSVWPNWIRGSLSLLGEAIDIGAALRVRGYPPGRNLGALAAMGREALSLAESALTGLFPGGLGKLLGSPPRESDPYALGAKSNLADAPKFFTNSITLKQFRDPEHPELACYTALIDSAMGVDRINRIGLMGDWDLLRGDPSGGYSINIHRYQAQPIIESLGIEVPAPYERARDGDIVSLRPTFPFWMDVDLLYGAGKVICSHAPGDDGGWIDERPEDAGPTGKGSQPPRPARAAKHHKIVRSSATSAGGFNTSLGAATQPIIGPFHFPDVTVQVYPLLADRNKLARFVDQTWNALFEASPKPAPMRLELMSSYVFMVVSVIGDKFGTMSSKNNNIGWWADREIAFCVPVKWWRGDKLISVALIEPFVFANKGRAVCTDREVNGRNSFAANIESADDVWMDAGGPVGARRLLHVSTEFFTALNQGQKAEQQTLLEIDERDALPAEDIEGWRAIADNWGVALAEDLKRRTALWASDRTRIAAAQSLALEPLARAATCNRLTLKQYRDASEMNRACYQAVVQTERAITRVHDIGELQRPVHVWLHQLPTHPLVDALGLKVKVTRSDGGGVVDCLQPIRPFWMRIGVKEKLGRVVTSFDTAAAVRRGTPRNGHAPAAGWIGDAPWFPAANSELSPTERKVQTPFFLEQGACSIVATWPRQLPQGDRRGLADKVGVWLQRALTNEIAWMNEEIRRKPEEARARMSAEERASEAAPSDEDRRKSIGTPGEDFHNFLGFVRPEISPPGPPAAGSFAFFLQTLPIERKLALCEALGKRLSSRPQSVMARGKWLNQLVLQVETIETLSAEERRSLREKLTTPAADRGGQRPGGDLTAAPTAQANPAKSNLAYFDDLCTALAPGVDRSANKEMSWLSRATADELGPFANAVDAALKEVLTRHSGDCGRAVITAAPEPFPSSDARPGLFDMLRRLEYWILCPAEAHGATWDSLIPDLAVEAVNNIRLKRFLADLNLDEAARRLVVTTLDFGGWEALESLIARAAGEKATPFHRLQREYDSAVAHGVFPRPLDPTAALIVASDKFGACVEDWRDPSRWERMSYADAGKTIQSIDEIQLVVEAILDHRWESRSAGPHANNPETLYPPSIPISSVGPVGGDVKENWAARHGLKRAPDRVHGDKLVATGSDIGAIGAG